MKKWIEDLIDYIQYKIIYKIKNYFYVKKYKSLYPDWEDNEFNCGDIKHIWGVKSWDDITGKNCNLYTMNDIDITYNRKTKIYSLSIETAYIFKDKKAECRYLRDLLNAFTRFMDDNGYLKEEQFSLFMNDTTTRTSAKNIKELYTNFRIFVEGFCKIYEV